MGSNILWPLNMMYTVFTVLLIHGCTCKFVPTLGERWWKIIVNFHTHIYTEFVYSHLHNDFLNKLSTGFGCDSYSSQDLQDEHQFYSSIFGSRLCMNESNDSNILFSSRTHNGLLWKVCYLKGKRYKIFLLLESVPLGTYRYYSAYTPKTVPTANSELFLYSYEAKVSCPWSQRHLLPIRKPWSLSWPMWTIEMILNRGIVSSFTRALTTCNWKGECHVYYKPITCVLLN